MTQTFSILRERGNKSLSTIHRMVKIHNYLPSGSITPMFERIKMEYALNFQGDLYSNDVIRESYNVHGSLTLLLINLCLTSCSLNMACVGMVLLNLYRMTDVSCETA